LFAVRVYTLIPEPAFVQAVLLLPKLGHQNSSIFMSFSESGRKTHHYIIRY